MSLSINPLANILVNNLRVGSVIHKFCDFTTPPKNKFLVVASLEPRLLVLMINSQVNNYYQLNNLDQFHVPVPEAEHSFLSHDSFTNCVEAHTAFDCSELRDEVILDYQNVFKGWLTDSCLESVYHAVKGNNVLRRAAQKEIMSSIEAQLPNLHSAF
jgi:hypothetical protein